MAKTLAQIIADVRQHIGQTDSTNSNFTDAQLTIWVNDAYRKIVVALRHLPITPNNYAVASQDITLNANTVTVDNVLLKDPDVNNDDGTAGRYQLLKQISLDQLVELDAGYANAQADMPLYFVRTGTFSAVLYPPPKASVIAQTTPLKTMGLELPAELAADSDTPSLPGNLHDIIGHWPAYRCFSELENQPKATEHITMFNAGIKDHKGISTQFSRRLKGWRWENVI